MTIPVGGKIIKGFVSSDGVLDAVNVQLDNTNLFGVLTGATDIQTGLARFDATGVGADVFEFTGAYSATASNISEWFGDKQLVRMRCTGRGGSSPGTLRFDLPGTTALTTAFDTLQTLGVAQEIQFRIEYTGDSSSFVSIFPRSSPSPQISGITNIIVRSNVVASIRIERVNGTIGDYMFTNISPISSTGGSSTFDSLKLQNPASVIWDASSSGSLPTTGVVKGNAYKVVNAPTDGTGRFGEVMYTDDWVVWNGETFTAWATEPHEWFVISAHDVRRISSLENDFLNNVQAKPEDETNPVRRGLNYADSAGEIRMKIYPTAADYSAADLNTTGDVDEYVDSTSQTGRLAIRLTGTQATLASVLPTLYVYAVTGSGETATYRLIGNLQNDFTYQGDFGAESDYLSNDNVNYAANDALRIYFGTIIDIYIINNVEIRESDLSESLRAKVNRTDGSSSVDNQRLDSVETKVAALYPLTPDVDKLVDFSDIYDTTNTVEQVSITHGYSLIADYRSSSDKYESAGVTYDDTGTNVVTYTGLSEDLHRAFGFKVSGASDKILMWLVDGSTRIPFIDITAAGNLRINNYTTATTQGDPVTNQIHFLTRTSGDEVVTTATNSLSTFTITNFPTGATDTSRILQVGTTVYLNGSNTQAEHNFDINLPSTNTAQAQQTVDSTIYLGPLHGNRSVTVTIGYTLRVSGSDLLIDFSLISAPSDVSISFTDIATLLNYTPAATTTRVDNFVIFTDAGGDYTFSGATDFLISFQPHQFDNAMAAVGTTSNTAGVIDSLNDVTIPQPSHSFDSVEIPDDIEFVTILPDHFFIHRDLENLIRRRGTKWAYGLALLQEVTDRQVTGDIDFTTGIILISPDTTRYRLTVADDGTLKTQSV